MPEQYNLVLSVAAEWCGVDTEEINAVVETYEWRLVKWCKAKQKETNGPTKKRSRARFAEEANGQARQENN